MSPIFEKNGMWFFYLVDDDGHQTTEESKYFDSEQDARESYDAHMRSL